uniref:Uncharacterized protein n=1 Tax=Siphoviridae sp. ctiJm4 TaxID=2827916 RepID=A0A8S5T149_9CAUD|nr:MAG TPA: hypothetical protein [Siphoviridae sp. ctiJm4]
MKVTITKKGSLNLYRFTRSDGRIFLVGRAYGADLQVCVNNDRFNAPFCLPLDLPLIDFVRILQGIKFDKTLQDQILKIDNKKYF